MKLPLSLIKSFIDLNLPVAEIGEVLTLLGIEVDKIHNEHPFFAGVVVGEVLSARRHPQADKLQIAEVTDGKETYTLVCGAPNCRPGLKTAFAKPGAVLGDLRIEKTTIRGIESSGMLCSEKELQLSENHGGILELPEDVALGTNLTFLLWDPVFEISLTPNLGHCMSALGIARELSASLQKPLLHPKIGVHEGPHRIGKEVIVSDFHLCPRYTCRLIEGIKVGPSPFWLQKQLEACGQKSINNVVDSANFIMLKMGQPLHAFDADLLEGNTLTIGPAKTAQKFLGLDGVERLVPAGTLLISDAQKAVAIAGIMGGLNSAVSEKTTRILLEAACFDPISIRVTAKKISLRTESAQRFEKGIDPTQLEEALKAVCSLIGGVSSKEIIDLKKGAFNPKQIIYRPSRVNQILGTKLSATEMEEIFVRLGFKVKGSTVEVPLYRTDIHEEIDLIEEIARIYGYNNIEKATPRCTLSQIPNDPHFVFENEVRKRLVALGLCECLTCDLMSQKLAEIAREVTPASMGFLQATYAKSEEYSILRTSLLPAFLQVVKRNLDQKNQTLAAFEIGRIHFLQKEIPTEVPMGAILLTGKATPLHWSRKEIDFDFFDLKGLVQNFLANLSIENESFQPSQHLSFHPGRQADIHVGDLIVGSLGEIHPALLGKFDIQQRVFYAELNLSSLRERQKRETRVMPLPQFPSSERDWTVPLNPETPIDLIFRAIHSPLLEKVELIDLYHPEHAEKKNATFRFTYRDRSKTISFEEVEAEHTKLIGVVTNLLAK